MSQKKTKWKLLWHHEEKGTLIYCQDGKWRTSPDYGTYPECVKFYSSPGWALRAVRFCRGEYTAVKELPVTV